MEKLSEAEEIVMRCIWDSEEPIGLSDIIEFCDSRYERQWKPQTVSTFLKRLIQKGYLESRRQGRTWLYIPQISQEDYLDRKMSGFLNFWGRKSIGALFCAFGKSQELTPEDIRELRELIDELDD